MSSEDWVMEWVKKIRAAKSDEDLKVIIYALCRFIP